MFKERATVLLIGLGVSLVSLFWPAFVSAHEVYVLSRSTYLQSLRSPYINIWESLRSADNLELVLMVILVILVTLVTAVLFSASSRGTKLDVGLRRCHEVARLMMRITLGVALLIGARHATIFGPELAIGHLASANLIQYSLYGLAILMLLGWMTELTAVALMVIYGLTFAAYGLTSLTYMNYLGVLIALFCFGAGRYAIDGRPNQSHLDLEALIVRVFFGLAFVFTAISIKLLHPAALLEVITQYNLTQFHWLFPSDPLLIVLGAALVELCLGLMIIFGFQTRLAILFAFFYLTLSLLFFREAVWPHLILYGVGLYLFIVGGGHIGLDAWLSRLMNRLFQPKKR